MRFAYIDSQGKEVAIPSVEALQLRIELGAITEETRFFDASTNRWAPAREHEVFRTLAREIEERGQHGFAAPPPPTLGKGLAPGGDRGASAEAGPPPPATPPPTAGPPDASESDRPEADAPAEPPSASGSEAPDDVEQRDVAGSDGHTISFPEGELEIEEIPSARGRPGDDLDMPGPVLRPPPDVGEEVGTDDPDAGTSGARPTHPDPFEREDDDARDAFGDAEEFDWGLPPNEGLVEEGAGGELELAPDWAADLEPESPEGPDRGTEDADTVGTPATGAELDEGPEVGVGATPQDQVETGEVEGDTPDLAVGGELELEEEPGEGQDSEAAEPEGVEGIAPLEGLERSGFPEAFDAEKAEAGDADSAAAEGDRATVVGEAEAEEAPTERATPTTDGGSGRPATPPAGEPSTPEPPVREPAPSPAAGRAAGEARAPGPQRRRRPVPPPRRSSRSSRLVPLAAGVVILGGAGWFAWTQFAAGPREDFVEEPVVEIPEIPEYLEEPLETSARAATLALADSLRALAGGLGEAPAPEWLSGNYLANASEFRDVRRYWTALGDYVERVRAAEEAVFAAVYAQQLDSMSMVGPDREALMERATAGFRSARIRREDIYRQLEDVVTAAVALHDFLLRNESSIEYEPAVAGLSRDPVTEALPATEELGEAMWQGVAEITSALDALGALDRVTTGRLLDLLFGKLAQTTID